MDVAARQEQLGVAGQVQESSTGPQNGRQSPWIGRWAGGRIKEGPRYVIERMARGKRYSWPRRLDTHQRRTAATTTASQWRSRGRGRRSPPGELAGLR
jgi:hypothetical protein